MKILIAEDEQYIREGLRDLLESEGYTIIEAQDGEQAVALYQSAKPDFMLLDIMMPKRDGYAVCKEIRRNDDDIPVVFISAKSEEIDRVVGLELGADDYIMKPFGTREVIARIRAITRRCLIKKINNADEKDQFFMSDLTVYPRELRAQRQQDMIELSLRDIKILDLLNKNKGKVVTRDMLFDYCWGRNYIPSSRTLDQHVSKLRKNIEIDPKQPLIICTVHGVGYRYDG